MSPYAIDSPTIKPFFTHRNIIRHFVQLQNLRTRHYTPITDRVDIYSPFTDPTLLDIVTPKSLVPFLVFKVIVVTLGWNGFIFSWQVISYKSPPKINFNSLPAFCRAIKLLASKTRSND